jgi:hypothetical protein
MRGSHIGKMCANRANVRHRLWWSYAEQQLNAEREACIASHASLTTNGTRINPRPGPRTTSQETAI